MNAQSKRTILFLLAAISLLVVLIAAALPDLRLEKGMPLPAAAAPLVNREAPPETTGDSAPPMDGNFMLFVLIVFSAGMLYTFIMIIRRLGWKTLRQALAIMIPVVIVMALVIIIITVFARGGAAGAQDGPPVPLSKQPVFTPLGPVPLPVLWITGILLAALAAFIVRRIVSARARAARPLAALGKEAGRAHDELLGGGNFKDVIIRCYRRMSAVLERERGLSRPDSMTTGEFELYLEAEGVPRESIRELTRLFESARYGTGKHTPAEERNAAACLETIVTFCRGGSGGDEA